MSQAAGAVGRISRLAAEKTPFFADVWQRQYNEFGELWARDISDALTLLFGSGEEGWEDALIGYADFSMQALRCQQEFEKTRRYREASAEELLSSCYEDEEFMRASYLPGLFLSHYLWRHHYKLLKFFREDVLPGAGEPANFCEVGVGTGLYSFETLRALPESHGKGVDISEYSLDFTRRLVRAAGLSGRYETAQMDVFRSLPGAPDSFDFVVCQEVLEHLEDPAKLCGILLELARPGAAAYITAAINAAHTDHIYLFRTPDEVEKMLVSAGWKIVDSRAEYAYEGKPKDVTPCVAGFFCRK